MRVAARRERAAGWNPPRARQGRIQRQRQRQRQHQQSQHRDQQWDQGGGGYRRRSDDDPATNNSSNNTTYSYSPLRSLLAGGGKPVRWRRETFSSPLPSPEVVECVGWRRFAGAADEIETDLGSDAAADISNITAAEPSGAWSCRSHGIHSGPPSGKEAAAPHCCAQESAGIGGNRQGEASTRPSDGGQATGETGWRKESRERTDSSAHKQAAGGVLEKRRTDLCAKLSGGQGVPQAL